jgi:hypothetical protein
MAKKVSDKQKLSSKRGKEAANDGLGVYINPLTDFGFKRLFNDPELLIDFLNQVLPDVKIKEVHYEDKELIGDLEAERRAVLDLLCKTESGEYVMIEMQRAMQTFFADRALFYGAHLIRKQAQAGKNWNYELKAVHVVFLFKKMFNLMQIKQLNTEDMEQYRKSVLEYDDIRDAIGVHAARAKRLGVQIGTRLGEERGVKIGTKIGEARGKATIVKLLLANGMPLKEISERTGISLDDIIHIIKN